MTSNDNNSTLNSAQLTGFLAGSADETLKSYQWINTTLQYRSASNSLLARTAYRIPKRDSKDVRTPRRSQSNNIHSVI
ncbi:hypothetical protein AVEN_240930-1 [Araneus ventricosus]|uniref:Uncharacterized protein n=1 Tax=Araneus ventricosus TaxID=182803 RepID=A0A4Y2UNZ1_ARAVE|nr:hypothetical protein AVEN_240930-1 [Araneus ventricosus]